LFAAGGGGQSGEGLLLAMDMDVGLGLLRLFTLLELLLFVGVCRLRLGGGSGGALGLGVPGVDGVFKLDEESEWRTWKSALAPALGELGSAKSSYLLRLDPGLGLEDGKELEGFVVLL